MLLDAGTSAPAILRGRKHVLPALSSISANVPADDAAGMPDGGSRHAVAGDAGPAWAASETNQGCHSIRLLKRRERHSLRRCCERERKGNSDQPDHRSLPMWTFQEGAVAGNQCSYFRKVPARPDRRMARARIIEVPGFNRCRKSATHAQCCEVRRMRCIVSTLVTARGRAAPPHQPRRYQPGPARRRRGCRRTAPLVDWRTTVQIG